MHREKVQGVGIRGIGIAEGGRDTYGWARDSGGSGVGSASACGACVGDRAHHANNEKVYTTHKRGIAQVPLGVELGEVR